MNGACAGICPHFCKSKGSLWRVCFRAHKSAFAWQVFALLAG